MVLCNVVSFSSPKPPLKAVRLFPRGNPFSQRHAGEFGHDHMLESCNIVRFQTPRGVRSGAQRPQKFGVCAQYYPWTSSLRTGGTVCGGGTARGPQGTGWYFGVFGPTLPFQSWPETSASHQSPSREGLIRSTGPGIYPLCPHMAHCQP